MDSTSSFYTAREYPAAAVDQDYLTVPQSNKSPEAAQEALINDIMGCGRQGRAAMLATGSDNYERPLRPASVKSQQYFADEGRPSIFAGQEGDEPVGHISDPDLFNSIVGGDGTRATTLPLRSTPRKAMKCTTPKAEEFYRSSSSYKQWAEEREKKRPAEASRSNRPLTPFPRTSSRRYAALPLPSARARANIDNVVIESQKPLLRRLYGPRQHLNPPPQRLPATYRAKTPFSFNRPPTTTPFSSAGARPMSPSHWLYNAPRVGGVQMEVSALQRATEGRAATHRALWPEEREETLGEVDGMAEKLVRGAAVVRDNEAVRGEEGVGERGDGDEKKKGKRFGWFRKLLGGGKKDIETEYGNEVHVMQPPTRTVEDEISIRMNEHRRDQPQGMLGAVHPSVPYAASARREQRDFSNDTTVVARSTPSIVAEEPPLQINPQVKSAKRKTPRLWQRYENRRRHWWQFVPRARLGYTPQSQEKSRKQTSLVIQQSRRQHARPRMVVESTERSDVVEKQEIEQRRLSVEDYFDCRGSAESVRVLRIRDV